MGMEKFNNAFGLSLLFMGLGTLLGNPIGGELKLNGVTTQLSATYSIAK